MAVTVVVVVSVVSILFCGQYCLECVSNLVTDSNNTGVDLLLLLADFMLITLTMPDDARRCQYLASLAVDARI